MAEEMDEESERDDEPVEAQEPEEPEEPEEEPNEPSAPDAPSLTDRLGAAARRALAATAGRLPAVQAVLVASAVRLAVSIVAGALLYASFPPLNWWWAAVLAAALLAWVLIHPDTTPAGGLGYGFLFGLAFYLPLLPWISKLVGAFPWVALAIVCALFPGVFGLLAVFVRGLPGWPIWFALVWTAQEWLKSIFPFGGFPWGLVAFGQAEGPLLPLVQLGGTALLSMAISTAGIRPDRDRAGNHQVVAHRERGRGVRLPRSGHPRCCCRPSAYVWCCLPPSWSGPRYDTPVPDQAGSPAIAVAAVQGNVPRLGLDFNSQRRAVLDNHVRETLRLAEDVRAGTAAQPQFVIWPEDSSDIDPFVNADAGQEITKAANAIGAPILIGTVLGAPGSTEEIPEYTNTVIVWNPVTGPADRHDKEIVQPFGEYLPMPWLFKHLSGYADRAGHFVPRIGSDVVAVGDVPVGVSTCWEVIFDREPRKAVLNGAQLLAVPANNATFNKTMSEQQLAFAKVRAVEHDRYVVVAGTTGISAVIAPDGHELARTDFFEPAYLDTQVRLKTTLTPATRWGPILQWILAALAGAAILAGIRHNGWLPRQIRLQAQALG